MEIKSAALVATECRRENPVNGHPAPDPGDEYLYYQNLLGMWPPLQKVPTMTRQPHEGLHG